MHEAGTDVPWRSGAPDLYGVGGFRTVNGNRQGFTGVPFVWRYRP